MNEERVTCPMWCKYLPPANDPLLGCTCDDMDDCPMDNKELEEDDHYVPTKADYLGI